MGLVWTVDHQQKLLVNQLDFMVQDQRHGPLAWTPSLESLHTHYVLSQILSQNKGPYFEPDSNKEETGTGPN